MPEYSMGTGAVGIGKPDPSPGRTAIVTVTRTRTWPDGSTGTDTRDTTWTGYTADDARRHRIDHPMGTLTRDGADLIVTCDRGEWTETTRYRFEDQP